ncbi:hypothetical protein [Saccharothrix sp. Mg75]|uniref:hypothetical protein n=1 Tax=Saccharothrix sp. Mg75 TaxID=3445357 RepID=UPI003EEAC183
MNEDAQFVNGDARLADLLRHARDHVPHYQRALRGARITDATAPDVLRGLPLLPRAEVRAAHARLWSAEGDTTTWRRSRTSGTSGLPVEVLVDQRAQEFERAVLGRRVSVLAPDARDPDLAVFHLTLHASATTRSLAYPGRVPGRLVKWNLSRAWRLPEARFAECVREVRGQVVTGMPWVLSAIADRVGSSAPLGAALVVMSGETVDEAVRERVSAAFGCPATAMYVTAEVGIAGVLCEAAPVYHAAEGVAVELVDDRGDPAEEGAVVLTSTVNRAMPLLRYVVGDRARWVDGACSCGEAGRRFRLDGARVTRVVATGGTGRRTTTLDFTKLLTHLDLVGVDVAQDDDGVVEVRHDTGSPVPTTAATMIAAAARGMLGPATRVVVRARPPVPDGPGALDPLVALGPPALEPGEVADWARTRLADEAGVRAAVLTGSFLSAETFTRHSDIDLVVLVTDDSPRWVHLARSMHRHVAGLRVNVDTAAALSGAPLLRARLLSERLPVLGDLEDCGVVFPARRELLAAAGPWFQEVRAVLWTQLTAASPHADPVWVAWLVARTVLNALRYHHLVRGGTTTEAGAVLDAAELDGVPGVREARATLDVAAERRPPLPVEWGGGEAALLGGLRMLGWVRSSLPAVP